MPGAQEWVIIIVVVALLFGGATAIPKLARSLGSAKGEFNKAKREFDAEARRAESTSASAPTPASDADVRKTARSLGIAEEGKSTDELKLLIQQKLA